MSNTLEQAVVAALLDKAARTGGGALARDLRRIADYIASPCLCAECDHGQIRSIDPGLLESLAHRCINCGIEFEQSRRAHGEAREQQR